MTSNRGGGGASDNESQYSKNSKAVSKAGEDDDDGAGAESGEDEIEDSKAHVQAGGIAQNKGRRIQSRYCN